jgi:hypothetical protein
MSLSVLEFFSWKKLKLIFLNTLNSLASQFSTLFVSLFVVRVISVECWGGYTEIMLWILLLGQLPAWGNKEYLLREFSNLPGSINQLWKESIVSRSILLIPVLGIVFFIPYSPAIKLYISSLLLIRYILQSYDSLIFYQRNYTLKFFLEIAWCLLFIAVLLFVENNSASVQDLLLYTVLLDLLKTVVMTVALKRNITRLFSYFSKRYLRKSFIFFFLGFTGLAASRIDHVSVAFFIF